MEKVLTVTDIITILKEKNILLWIENDSLKFKAPTGAMSDDVISLLTLNKPELINFFNQKKNCTTKKYLRDEIPVIKNKNLHYLSSGQRRLWILNELEEGCVVYNIPGAMIIKGLFVEEAFSKAYNYVLNRHESLRTVFVNIDGEIKQKIIDGLVYKIQIINLKEKSLTYHEQIDYLQKEFRIPFNLESGPLIKFKILQLEDNKYLLLFNMHHIISDGWSMSIFVKELLTAYLTYKDGMTPIIKPLRIHYKDYSNWYNDLVLNGFLDNQKDYWVKKLEGELPVIDLPSDNTRPTTQTFNGNNINFNISNEHTLILHNICKHNQITLFIMLQALIKILLYKYTGQEDIILGSPIAGRTHRNLENQIGFYVNTLAFRDSINGELTVKEFLADVKNTCLDGFSNQDYPFDKLIEDLEIKKNFSRSPIFDVMLVLQNNDINEIRIDGLEIIPINFDNITSKFDMTFAFNETEGGLNCNIEFNSDIYNEDRIIRMKSHLETLILSTIYNIDNKIKNLEIISKNEKKLILNIFNDTKIDYPMHKTIVDLFEEQVQTTPDNIAVVFEDIRLTYRELNEKSNIVAHYLRDKYNIQPDNLIGVLINRSDKMIIALLGILKSGGAYVPIDPQHPEDRINHMIEDSNPVIIIGEQEKNRLIDINKVLDTSSCNANLKKITNSKNIAYVIYTSGSTGKPKGVKVEHRSIINFLSAINITFKDNITSNDNFISIVNYSFDVSVFEIFTPLIKGAKLFIYKHVSIDIKLYCDYLQLNNITIAYIHPGILDNIATYLKGKSVKLSKLLVGVEPIKNITLNKFIDLNNEMLIINGYGPTECTVCSTMFHYMAKKNTYNIPIGKPISNTKIYILNKYKKLVPIGTPGEIFISGDGLARGYLNRSALTSDKFVNNPYILGERMYRTGDLAQWLPDGNLEFLGRLDHQVKIRGFRIELGEIENTLEAHKLVNSALVIAKDIHNEKQLIVYYTSKDDLNISELKQFLSKSLPDYMIPSFFIKLERFLLTSNGKVDIKSLPEVSLDGIITGVEYAPPITDIEKKLTSIWKDILGVSNIGINDNFFDLGGNSLNSLIYINSISKVFHISIQYQLLFKYKTIKNLSVYIHSIICNNEKSIVNKNNILTINKNLNEGSVKLAVYTKYNLTIVVLYIYSDFNSDFINTISNKILNNFTNIDFIVKICKKDLEQIKIIEEYNFDRLFFDIKSLFNMRIRNSILNAIIGFESQIKKGHQVDCFKIGGLQEIYLKRHDKKRLSASIEIKNTDFKDISNGINKFVENNPILRSLLLSRNEEFFFFEYSPVIINIPLIDLSHIIENFNPLIEDYIKKICEQGKKIAVNKLFYIIVFKINNNKSVIFFSLDHMISDKISIDICSSEISDYIDKKIKIRKKSFYKEYISILENNYENLKLFKSSNKYITYKESVLNLREKFKTPKLSNPYYLELPLSKYMTKSKSSKDLKLSTCIYITGKICSILFDLNSVPLRILSNRRRLGSKLFNNTIGDMHDNLPYVFYNNKTEIEDIDIAIDELNNILESSSLNLSFMRSVDDELNKDIFGVSIILNFLGYVSKLDFKYSKQFFSSYSIHAGFLPEEEILVMKFYNGVDKTFVKKINSCLEELSSEVKFYELVDDLYLN